MEYSASQIIASFHEESEAFRGQPESKRPRGFCSSDMTSRNDSPEFKNPRQKRDVNSHKSYTYSRHSAENYIIL